MLFSLLCKLNLKWHRAKFFIEKTRTSFKADSRFSIRDGEFLDDFKNS